MFPSMFTDQGEKVMRSTKYVVHSSAFITKAARAMTCLHALLLSRSSFTICSRNLLVQAIARPQQMTQERNCSRTLINTLMQAVTFTRMKIFWTTAAMPGKVNLTLALMLENYQKFLFRVKRWAGQIILNCSDCQVDNVISSAMQQLEPYESDGDHDLSLN